MRKSCFLFVLLAGLILAWSPMSALADLSNPDGYSYRYVDNRNFSAYPFFFEDISGIGDTITDWFYSSGAAGDNSYDISCYYEFMFPFYTNDYSGLLIGSNGYVTFEGGCSDSAGVAFPSMDNFKGDAFRKGIAAFYTDLTCYPSDSSGYVFSYFDTTAYPNKVIVQWGTREKPVRVKGTGAPEVFEIILYSDGRIVFNYLVYTAVPGAVAGYQQNDLHGLSAPLPSSGFNSLVSVAYNYNYDGECVENTSAQWNATRNLGFTMPWYGSSFTQMGICTNGWTSLSDFSSTTQTGTIPGTALPNATQAANWKRQYNFWFDQPPCSSTVNYTNYTDNKPMRAVVRYDRITSNIATNQWVMDHCESVQVWIPTPPPVGSFVWDVKACDVYDTFFTQVSYRSVLQEDGSVRLSYAPANERHDQVRHSQRILNPPADRSEHWNNMVAWPGSGTVGIENTTGTVGLAYPTALDSQRTVLFFQPGKLSLDVPAVSKNTVDGDARFGLKPHGAHWAAVGMYSPAARDLAFFDTPAYTAPLGVTSSPAGQVDIVAVNYHRRTPQEDFLKITGPTADSGYTVEFDGTGRLLERLPVDNYGEFGPNEVIDVAEADLDSGEVYFFLLMSMDRNVDLGFALFAPWDTAQVQTRSGAAIVCDSGRVGTTEDWSFTPTKSGRYGVVIFCNGRHGFVPARYLFRYYRLLHVTVRNSYTGGEIMVDGTARPSPYVTTWYPDVEHSLEAISPVLEGTRTRYLYRRWADGILSSNRAVRTYQDTTFTALFDYQHYLVIRADYGGTTRPDSGWYNHDTTFTLTVVTPTLTYADTLERFMPLQWEGTGDGSYTGGMVGASIALHEPIDQIFHWRHEYRYIVVIPFGTGRPPSGWYAADTTLTLGYTPPGTMPGERYHFDGWTGTPDPASYTGPDSTHVLTLSSWIKETANIAHEYYVEVTADVGSALPTTGWYAEGSHLSLEAVPPPVGSGIRHTWQGWTGTGSVSYTGMNETATIIVNSAITEHAAYIVEYYLRLVTNYGSVTPLSNYYPAHSVQTITALHPTEPAGTRYIWQGWRGVGSGSYTGMDTLHTVTMDSAMIDSAFWRKEYYLTISAAPGTVTAPAGWYRADTTITEAATPPVTGEGERYSWWRWTGSIGRIDSVISFTLSNPMTITGNWHHQYYYTVTTNSGTCSPISDWRNAGASFSIVANGPASGDGIEANFLGWTGTGTGSYTGLSNPGTVTLNGPVTEDAQWSVRYRLDMLFEGSPEVPAMPNDTGEIWINFGDSLRIWVQSPINEPPPDTNTRYTHRYWYSRNHNITFQDSTRDSTWIWITGPDTVTSHFNVQYRCTFNKAVLNDGRPDTLGFIKVNNVPYTRTISFRLWLFGGISSLIEASEFDMFPALDSMYYFTGWSDGLGILHGVSPNAPTTFTAYYQLVGTDLNIIVTGDTVFTADMANRGQCWFMTDMDTLFVTNNGNVPVQLGLSAVSSATYGWDFADTSGVYQFSLRGKFNDFWGSYQCVEYNPPGDVIYPTVAWSDATHFSPGAELVLPFRAGRNPIQYTKHLWLSLQSPTYFPSAYDTLRVTVHGRMSLP